MKWTVRIIVLLAIVIALSIGCSGSGNGGGDSGTLTVSVTNVDSLWAEPLSVAQVLDWYLIFAVVPEGQDPGSDTTTFLAIGEALIVAGDASATAYGEGGALWKGENGTTYDVYVILDEGGDGDPDPGTDFVVSSTGDLEPQRFQMNGDASMEFDDSDFELLNVPVAD